MEVYRTYALIFHWVSIEIKTIFYLTWINVETRIFINNIKTDGFMEMEYKNGINLVNGASGITFLITVSHRILLSFANMFSSNLSFVHVWLHHN